MGCFLAASLYAVPPACADGFFEIVRATADAVWRLDKRTGEIAKCREEGSELVCAPARERADRSRFSHTRTFVFVRPPLHPHARLRSHVHPHPHPHGQKAWRRK